MDFVIEKLLFFQIQPPNVNIKRPWFLEVPSARFVGVVVLCSYALFTAGIVYNVINEPPSVGSTVDERGISRVVPVMPHRVNGQYIMEGVLASFLFSLGGVGFIVLDWVNGTDPTWTKNGRFGWLIFALISVTIAFFGSRSLMHMKMPGYLSY
uniref:Oligosaccharyltransferase complex subunit n=1 Tax=Steinernema glaseri TaxID=37863 RepID=A0A1I8AMG3_9BILA